MISLATERLGVRADRLGAVAKEAHAAGFARLFASVPPADAEAARKALGAAGLALDGVSTAPPATLAAVPGAIDAAARAAASLRTRLVVLDAARLAAGASPAADLETLARALFDAFVRWSGATIAVRAGAGTLLDLAAAEALLSDLASKPIASFLDPRSVQVPAAWAERLAAKTAGIVLSVGIEPDWGTLRGLLSARAVRVLEVGPEASTAEVVLARRRFEESLKF